MPEISASGLSSTDVLALIAAAGVPQFVNGGALMTVDDLFATNPANVTNRGKYARLSNYGGFVDRVVRCDYDTGLNLYFWTPTQPEYGRSLTVTGDVTLYALKSPQSVNLTGTIPALSTRNVTIDLANRRRGEIVEIRNGLSSLLGTLNILSTGIGTVVANVLGGYMRFMFDGSSGSLQLVRLQ